MLKIVSTVKIVMKIVKKKFEHSKGYYEDVKNCSNIVKIVMNLNNNREHNQRVTVT